MILSTGRPNHCWKSIRLANPSGIIWSALEDGIKKYSSDHNSMILFCNGVPVRRRRCSVLKFNNAFHLCDRKFLMLCASSRIITLNPGANRLNSISQFNITEVGTTIRCGPQMFFSHARYEIREMVWIVFPRPISSARIPLVPLLYNEASQFKPCFWYSLNVPRRRIGTGTSGMAALSSASSISSEDGGVSASPGSSLILLLNNEARPGRESSDKASSSDDSDSDSESVSDSSALSLLSSRIGSLDSSISFCLCSSVNWSTTLTLLCSPLVSTPYKEASVSGSSSSDSSSESFGAESIFLYFSRSSSTVSLLSSFTLRASSASLSSLSLELIFSSSSEPELPLSSSKSPSTVLPWREVGVALRFPT
ncbi:hypothetical protein OGAPHI_000047 [Ogataea philodendri]|uniref:Uncharacterized protein n=1 Tax=Ogataea philodendri TaxID=1378263 RepID=A0A9P8PH35_9ASCO|nr:uncharacterized protein OGAPHI_000047 [Ogataea philodendri]KAH3671861.1 hypothetical protein OGAPHI_000047 [Ogataea philodendri]